MPLIEFVAFDLDGTLVDSVADIAWAVDRMAGEMDMPPPGFDKVREWVGDGVRRLVKRALTGERNAEPDAELYQRAFEAFRRAYHAHLAVGTQLYPGAREVLEQLQHSGIGLACITNKAAEFTAPLLDALELKRYFAVVLSGDSLARRKPDPLPLLHAARQLGVAPARSCMVGDSRNDVLAARAAGFRAVAVRHGYGGDLLVDSAPDAVLDSLTELPSLLERWAPGLVQVRTSRYV
ncbi:MAG TPA: phosphoglycolate phosphatase [Gammaproteobacteria bacterium]|nr:phosphoglycolate phosphatase [Gammaproteobacteria bacterium]